MKNKNHGLQEGAFIERGKGPFSVKAEGTPRTKQVSVHSRV